MLPNVLERFIKNCPAAVMVRAVLERLWQPEKFDQIFEDVSERQYKKQLLFSQAIAIMAAVVTRAHSSVHSAYLAMTPRKLSLELLRMAKHVKLSRYPKKKRGSKKPQPRKKSGARNHHIATSRILAISRVK